MNIYIDFDDCLCETAKSFSDLVKEMFGKDVPYDQVQFFDLQKTFDLTDDQYQDMMAQGHRPEVLLGLEETEDAAKIVNSWLDMGHQINIITGRPYAAYEPSRQWLDNHGLERVKLYCLNKYNRDSFYGNSVGGLELEDFYKMKFDFAIEDSPAAFKYLTHLPELRVMVVDRPWNRKAQFPNENFKRAFDWQEIDAEFRQCLDKNN
ncbi:MAG: 2-dehydropantoate 2-reductase [Pseudobutyrivibrio sp.]|nr:2-dehydropantoate 2-reductase [Pseudobutyrivibrio sp.]